MLKTDENKISIAEFFEKNRHILGFENSQRALLTSVKEAVDNSLDACESAGILPSIRIEIVERENHEFEVNITDNGPGIDKNNIASSFGSLLYGTKFHSVVQARGQQGIGISAAVLYSQITTGKPAKIISKRAEDRVAYVVKLMINLKKNEPEIMEKEVMMWEHVDHGLSITLFMKGKYQRGKQSIYEYIKNTAIVNPHITIELIEPDKNIVKFARVTDRIPRLPKVIKPYIYGIEIGNIMEIIKRSPDMSVKDFFLKNFSNISTRIASEIESDADVKNIKIHALKHEHIKRIVEYIKKLPVQEPTDEALIPIEEDLIKKGLKNVIGALKPDYYVSPVTGKPKIWNGNPFIVEAGMVWGGDLPADQPIQILRYANRVPLLFQQGGCLITNAISSVNWKQYGLEQRGGSGIPSGPAVALVHVASTKIPYTSEAKEAIAEIPEIENEIKEVVQRLGRRLRMHLNKEIRRKKIEEKFEIINEILPLITEKTVAITGRPEIRYNSIIAKIMNVLWVNVIKENTGEKGKKYTIQVTNYTSAEQQITVYIDCGTVTIKSLSDKNVVNENGRIKWIVKNIDSGNTKTLSMEILSASDDAEIYYADVTGTEVIGIEPLPGDWDIDMPVIEENEEDSSEEDEDEQDS